MISDKGYERESACRPERPEFSVPWDIWGRHTQLPTTTKKVLPAVPSTIFLDKDGETLLLEVMVVGQNLSQGVRLHDIHGDTIRQAVLLILAVLVASHTLEKTLSGLLNNTDICVAKNGPYHFRSFSPQRWTATA